MSNLINYVIQSLAITAPGTKQLETESVSPTPYGI